MIDFSSFAEELTKIAATTPADRAHQFLSSETKDWKAFERNLKNPAFQKAVITATDDKKLKKYTRAVGTFRQSKDVVEEAPSRSTNTKHKLKTLPSGRMGCDCKDWQYKHSWKGTDCDHIRAFKKSGITKLSNAMQPFVSGVYRGMGGSRTVDRAQKKYKAGLEAKQGKLNAPR